MTPWAPRRRCAMHGTALARGAPCRQCAQAFDLKRRDAHFAFYTSAAWRAIRLNVLLEEPFCADGCGRLSEDVDHLQPRSACPEAPMAWHARLPCPQCEARGNLRALAHGCHAKVTGQRAP
jgi:hypothetical protein